MPGIDLSEGWDWTNEYNFRRRNSALCLAIHRKYMEIAAILESKGATCTEQEKCQLGNKYSKFISFMTDRRSESGGKGQAGQGSQEAASMHIESAIQEKDRMILQLQATIQEKQKEINKLNNTLREKGAITQRNEAIIQEKDRIIQENKARMQENDRIIQEKEAIIQQKQKKMQREEQRQRQLWKFKQNQAQQIDNFQDLQLISEVAHGCDGMVFNCSALQFGIPSVALKILFNLGIDTTHVSASFVNEFANLKELPFHPNIIPIWKNFQDRPTQAFLDLFPPDLKSVVINNKTGTVRSTTCILMPILECFNQFAEREFKKLGVSEKLSFIEDIMSGLMFLDENNVVHRDMKLNNLLINSSGRIIISDFGCSTKLLPDKSIYIPPGGSLGGNPVHLAPEIKKINTSLIPDAVKVDYSKQASFELGMVAFEIFFGDVPHNKFGEHMDDAYFNKCMEDLCVDDSHKIPEMFEWLRGLLYSDPQRRTALLDSVALFHHIQDKF